MGKNTVQTKIWLDEHYPNAAPGKSTICLWFGKFRTGHMSTDDAARSGRPRDAVTDENIKKAQQMILKDRHVKLSDIAEKLKISKERVGHIVHEHLGMRKMVKE